MPSDTPATGQLEPSEIDLEREQATDLPNREAMTIIEPGLGFVDLGPDLPPLVPGLDPEDTHTVPKGEEPVPIHDPGENS